MLTDQQYNLSPPVASGYDKTTVVLFGEVLIDVFPDRMLLGGAPFNVARHLRGFGLHPVLISRTGNDELREPIIDAMLDWGMDIIGIQSDPLHPTGQVAVHINDDGHQFEILDHQAYDFIHPGITRMVELGVHPKLLYFGTLAQRHKISRSALSALLRSTSTARLLDLNLRAPWYNTRILNRSLEHANIVKMSDDELATLAKMLRLPGNDTRAQAAALIKRFELERVLVTCGKDGAWLLDKDGMQAEDRGSVSDSKVIDTVGAGDAFAAVFMAGMLLGWPTYLTMSRANDFSAAICGIRGATPQTKDFYRPFLREWGL
ncbi:MAG TPA: carbohydrate kinase [Methylophilaceae bacterium]|jgi:fructokinase